LCPGRPDSLRPAEEPSLLHEFNRVRGIPADGASILQWTTFKDGVPLSDGAVYVASDFDCRARLKFELIFVRHFRFANVLEDIDGGRILEHQISSQY
jgi:hypothetical protein